MRWFAISGTVVAIILAGALFGVPGHAHRFRLALEVDTPEGVRSASSVIEVHSDTGAITRGFSVRGEGVFLNLGGGRNVVAILAHGDNAEWGSNIIYFWVEAYGRGHFDDRVWSGWDKLRGVVELLPPLIPTLVTFADPLDPWTVRVVRPDEFEEAFGPGYRFRRATVEVLPNGWWPANALGLSTGEPYTRGVIQQQLPWLAGMTTNIAGTRSVSTNDLRERLGPRSFRRQDP